MLGTCSGRPQACLGRGQSGRGQGAEQGRGRATGEVQPPALPHQTGVRGITRGAPAADKSLPLFSQSLPHLAAANPSIPSLIHHPSHIRRGSPTTLALSLFFSILFLLHSVHSRCLAVNNELQLPNTNSVAPGDRPALNNISSRRSLHPVYFCCRRPEIDQHRETLKTPLSGVRLLDFPADLSSATPPLDPLLSFVTRHRQHSVCSALPAPKMRL